MFISTAYAQTAAASENGSSSLSFFLTITVVFAIFYFLIIRPQNKRHQEHQKMMDRLKRGDKVVTGGGIIATIIRIREGDSEVTLEIAEGTRVKALRSSLSTLPEIADNNDKDSNVTKSKTSKKAKKDKAA